MVGVRAVPQRQSLVTHTRSRLHLLGGVVRGVHLAEVVCDGLVVALGALERLESEPPPGLLGDLPLLLPLGEDRVVVGRAGDDGHAGVVLGSCAEEGDAADVDLFDGSGEGAVRLGGLEDEGVQVADDEGDGRDLVGGQIGEVRVDLAGQNA